jgi:hypothetical protein
MDNKEQLREKFLKGLKEFSDNLKPDSTFLERKVPKEEVNKLKEIAKKQKEEEQTKEILQQAWPMNSGVNDLLDILAEDFSVVDE